MCHAVLTRLSGPTWVRSRARLHELCCCLGDKLGLTDRAAGMEKRRATVCVAQTLGATADPALSYTCIVLYQVQPAVTVRASIARCRSHLRIETIYRANVDTCRNDVGYYFRIMFFLLFDRDRRNPSQSRVSEYTSQPSRMPPKILTINAACRYYHMRRVTLVHLKCLAAPHL